MNNIAVTNNSLLQQMAFCTSSQMGLPDFAPCNPPTAFFSPTMLAADAAESGLTFNSVLSVPPAMELQQRKRQRADCAGIQQQNRAPEVSFYFLQQQMEINSLISDHVEKLRAEVWQRRSGFLQRLAAAAEGRIKAKEDEIDQVRRLNATLEERVRTLSVENQIWRDVAQSNEATALSLRNDLETALLQQQLSRRHVPDAESCCDNGGPCDDGDECDSGREWKGEAPVRGRRVCRGCGREEASVLLLPCRHLCLCSICASRAQECPACGCSKQCTVHVNFS